MSDKPSVLFVCVHNAGRSQMAAAWLTHLAGDRVEVRSAGSNPGDAVNPAAVEAMAEVGIDISAETPKILTIDAVQESDVCITMGCGDTCPVFPGKRYLDWALEDPAGQGVDAVRPIRDEIKTLVTITRYHSAGALSGRADHGVGTPIFSNPKCTCPCISHRSPLLPVDSGQRDTATPLNVVSGVCGLVKRALTR